MAKRICVSYCEGNGECGLDIDEDEDGNTTEEPSSYDGGYCLDDGEDKGCDEFYCTTEEN